MNVIDDINKELLSMVDEQYKLSAYRFFKEEVNFIGVRADNVRKLASVKFKEVSKKSKLEIFRLCEQLLEKNTNEEAFIAFDWAYRLNHKYDANDFAIFELWLRKYVTNWALCDQLCTAAFGCLLFNFDKFIPKVREWSSDPNRWVRRASAVIFIYGMLKERGLMIGKYADDAFNISDRLIADKDDMVQKGCGWLLKRTSQVNEDCMKRVFDYVIENRNKMSRITLRYAIEKMPESLRKAAMS